MSNGPRFSGFRSIFREDKPPKDRDGGEHIINAEVNERDVAEPVDATVDSPTLSERTSSTRTLIMILVGVVIALVLVVMFLPGINRAPNTFVILVAPFTSEDENETGQQVATQLVDLLQPAAAISGDVTVELANTAPTNAEEARDLVVQRRADALVWGNVRSGGMLNDTSMIPFITYLPTGPSNANVWAGYKGRFLMPETYLLANAPINGQVVLPRLLNALADYHQGDADMAATSLDALLQDYPADLNQTLPLVLRGNVLWARGAHEQAADVYRRALAQPTGVTDAAKAWIANNLGAILLDAGNPTSEAVLSEATQLLGTQDSATLRFNWGIYAQQQGDTDAAIASFEQARNLFQSENTPLLLALAHVYRENGQLDAAERTLIAAANNIPQDLETVPANQQEFLERYLNAGLEEQRGLLQLAQLVNARGPLLWELEITPPLASEELSAVQDRLQVATAISQELMNEWHRLAPSEDVILAGAGLTANGQAQRAEEAYERQRYYLSLALIEEGRNEINQPRGLFSGLQQVLFGNAPPLREAQEHFEALLSEDPDNMIVRIAYARSLRYGQEEAQTQAEQRYDQLINLPVPPPEGYYGKSLLVLQRGDRERARTLLEQAIQSNAAFFPARLKLAQIAREDEDWGVALEQLRFLSDQRIDPYATVRFASALRQSGPSNYAEAEQVLFDLAENGNVMALIELGRVYRDAGQLDAAVASFQEAQEINPASAVAAFELGQTYMNEMNAPEQAEQQFLDAIANATDTALAHVALADLYAGPLERPVAAEEHYQLAIEAGIRDIDTLSNIGNVLLEHEQGRIAAETFNLALREQPNNPRLHHGLAQAYLLMDNLNNAQNEENRALEILNQQGVNDLPLRTAILVGLADIAREQGDYDRAIGLYNEVLGLDTTHVDAKIGLGEVFASQGNWAVALGHFQNAVTYPDGLDDPAAHFWVGEALLRQPDAEAAVRFYQQALELRTDYPEALLGLAQAQYALRNVAEAGRSIEQALDLQPEYAEALLFQGKMLQAQGSINDALNAYSASIAANNNIAESRYRRALIFIQQQNYSDAADDLRQAVNIQSNFPEAYYWMGRAYFAQNRSRQALFAFERAVEQRGGSYTQARLYQGMAEKALAEQEGDKREAAINSFQAVIQADGDGEWGIMARSELESMDQ